MFFPGVMRWFEMRCRCDVSVPIIMLLIDIDVPSCFIHIQSTVRMDPCDLLSCVDIETMLIYTDILDVQFYIDSLYPFLDIFPSLVSFVVSRYKVLALALVEVIYYIPRIRRIGGCYGFTSKPPAARRPPPAACRPPPAARRPQWC